MYFKVSSILNYPQLLDVDVGEAIFTARLPIARLEGAEVDGRPVHDLRLLQAHAVVLIDGLPPNNCMNIRASLIRGSSYVKT